MIDMTDQVQPGRCGSCKHWSKHSDKTDAEYHGQHAGECSSSHFVWGAKPAVDGLAYWDFDDTCAGFNTGEQFGCVHWEPRNGATLRQPQGYALVVHPDDPMLQHMPEGQWIILQRNVKRST